MSTKIINQIGKNLRLCGFLSVLLSLSFTLFYSCSQEPIGQTPTNNKAPGQITNPTVENLPGGAKISYTLPNDNDMLYVKAVYTVNGIQRTDASSLYANSVQVMGFGTTDEETVLLYSVDRSGNQSEPVDVKIHPTTPPIKLIQESMTVADDWGGIKLAWENKYKAPVAIYILATDSVGDLYTADVAYSSLEAGNYNVRGFDSIPRRFGVFVRDRYDNYSDTLFSIQHPMFEQLLDKKLFKQFSLYGDNMTNLGPLYTIDKFWDDNYASDNFYHQGDQDPNVPNYVTIDLGVTALLNRYTLWERPIFYYQHYNLKHWILWGTDELKLTSDPDYWLEGFKDDWSMLADCVAFQPSGGPTVTQEDNDFASQGFAFAFPGDVPVRYVRIEMITTFSGNPFWDATEITFWGKILNN